MARGTPEPPRGQRGRKRKPGPPLARRAQAGRRPGKARGHWGHVCFAASTFVDCALMRFNYTILAWRRAVCAIV